MEYKLRLNILLNGRVYLIYNVPGNLKMSFKNFKQKLKIFKDIIELWVKTKEQIS